MQNVYCHININTPAEAICEYRKCVGVYAGYDGGSSTVNLSRLWTVRLQMRVFTFQLAASAEANNDSERAVVVGQENAS